MNNNTIFKISYLDLYIQRKLFTFAKNLYLIL